MLRADTHQYAVAISFYFFHYFGCLQTFNHCWLDYIACVYTSLEMMVLVSPALQKFRMLHNARAKVLYLDGSTRYM